MAAKRKAKARRSKPKPSAGKAAPKSPKGPRIGDRAPDFSLPTDGTGTVTLSALRGKSVIVYFYPRDDTPGCTKEACGFNDNLPNFSRVHAEIIGVSKDNESSHARFRDKFGLKFRLAADTELRAAKAYGVWIEKSLYGRKYMGMDRATYLIDKHGMIRGVWRGVKVPGHVEEVLKAAQAL